MKLPIDFETTPLVPVVIQDDESRDVLMVAFMNQLAFERTLETGSVHFWSRSRNQLWKKGETSGHTQEVVSIAINCEDNSLLIQVLQKGAVCHTGHRTCYYRQVLPDGSLFETSDPVFDPRDIYGDERSDEALWYGAYQYLRKNDLTAVSGTSRLLRTRETPPFERIADELEELAGVLAGEHRHSDLESDLLLEGSQVLYWVAVCGVLLGVDPEAQLELAAGLSSHPEPKDTETVIDDVRHQAEIWRGDRADVWEFELKETVWLVGEAMSAAAIDPIRLIERDLDELKSRPYLHDYFASSGV